MANDPLVQAKASSLRALMNNSDMSETLWNAFEAPLGSTQSQKGAAILGSVNQNAMGQYGVDPANVMGQYGTAPANPALSSSTAMPFAGTPKPPAPGPTAGMPDIDAEATPPKTFFLKSIDNWMADSPLGEALQKAPNQIFSPGTPGVGSFGFRSGSMEAGTTAPGGIGMTGKAPGFSMIGDPARPYQYQGPSTEGMSIADRWAYIRNQGKTASSAPVGDTSVETKGQYTHGEAVALAKEMAKSGKPWGEIYHTIKDKYNQTVSYVETFPEKVLGMSTGTGEAPAGDQYGPEAPGDLGGDEDAIDPETGVRYDSGLDASSIIGMPEQMREQWYNSLDPAAKEDNKVLYDMLKSGKGADAFAIKMMADKATMAKLLGVPVEALKDLPESGLISQHLSDLLDAKKQKYHVDSLLDSLVEKQAAGLSVKSDLEAYVRGKDEYLGTIDKMLDSAETKIANMDTSNPNINGRMQNWVNYLTVLEGRQNQRYTDYLNTSIKYQSDDINRTNLMYQYAATKAKEEYDAEAPIDVEEFNNYKTMLTNMYKSVDDRTNGTSELFKNQLELLKTKQEIANAVLDGQLKSVKLKTDTLDYKNKLSGKPDKILPQDIAAFRASFFPKDAEFKDPNTGATVSGFKYRDPLTVIQNAEATGQNTAGLFNVYTSILSDELVRSVRSGNFKDLITKYKGGEQDLVDTIMALKQAGEEEKAQYLLNNLNSFVQAEKSGLISGGASLVQSNMEDIRKVITNLGKKKYKSEAALAASAEGQAIGADASSILYSTYSNSVNAGAKPKEFASTYLNMGDAQLADTIGQNFADLYMNF